MAKLTLDWRERRVDIEYQWVNTNQVDTNSPVMVFLHEGLGSVALWKDFPEKLCMRIGMRGLIYSRPGYGQSTPRAKEAHWAPDFMHHQAHEVLPMLLQALSIDQAWLFGHSDGGSIALLFAAKFPASPSGVIVVAPHLFVEQISIDSIQIARQAYLQGDLRERLARYHDDVDSAFFGWNDAWLSPAFASWNIEESIPEIRCPILAMQGEQDEYGSLQQIQRIQALKPTAAVVSLPNCGHSAHRDQPDLLMKTVADFIQPLR